jgi:hypothetical protein
MNVICAGMFRAASTWQHHVAAALLPGHHDHGFCKDGGTYAVLPLHDCRIVKTHDRSLVYTHVLGGYPHALAIYAYRDLRDVVYSLMFKNAAPFEDVVGMLGEIVRNDFFWRSQPNTIVQRYETIVVDPYRAVSDLAMFLEADADSETICRIVDDHSLVKERRRAPEHVRDGRVGSWRDVATGPERRLIANAIGAWLVERGYEPDDGWIEAA